MDSFLGKRIKIGSGKNNSNNQDSLYQCFYCGGELDLESYDAMHDYCDSCRYKLGGVERSEFVNFESGINNIDLALLTKLRDL